MKNLKKLLSLLLALAIIFSMAACKKDGSTDGTDDAGEAGGETYTINVKTAGGMAMEGLDIFVYADDTLTDMEQAGKTDANGSVSFTMKKSSYYAVTVTGASKGYNVEKSYAFEGNTANIKLTSSVITDEQLGNAGSLKLGDVMYDFSYTLPDGTTKMLSEVLAEKDMVMLNFWFASCGPCATEFPYMEQAYQIYKEDAEIIALSYIDTNADVATYQASMGLTFDMAACNASWPGIFGFSNFPSTVIIDRYGVISLIEVGALTSLRPFTSIFEHFCGDDYEQKLCANGVADVITAVKPTEKMASSEEIAAVLNSGDIQVTYHPEDDDSAEMAWPFVISELNGEKCLKTSNAGIEDSFAMLYADVTLQKGQAVGFDYLVSTELGADIMYVIVDGEDIFSISGWDAEPTWKSCYPWVAQEDGTYEVALCYLKDGDGNEGDDAVYIKNMRVVDQSAIDVATYIPFNAATSEDGFEYTYADIFYNENDDYYHVDSVNGPLLLVDMMGYTQFSDEDALWTIAYEGAAKDLYPELEIYFNYASNAKINGVCTVNKELAEILTRVDEVAGFDKDDDKEWLKFCRYYKAYGTTKQLEDPIKGLATFSAYEAKLGKGIETNSFTYSNIIMPRGYLAKFVPSRSGVYRITSHNDSTDGVEGWIFNENREVLYTHEFDERMFNEDGEVSMVFYMEAGKSYFIDIAYWDYYGAGTITYDIEYIGATYELFRLCSPGYFTYDTDATGEAMYDVIAGGIKAVLGSDGIYYEDKGLDANGKQIYGSKIYADFNGLTSVFSEPINTNNGVKGLIDKGAFDFSKDENDMLILAYMAQNDNDVDKTDKYLRDMWGEDYEANAELYKIKDVFKGRYHGSGEDLTAEISAYLDDIITSGREECRGCVVVTEDLAELLSKLMNKFTFENVEQSWLKLCYYYDYLGPEG